MAVPSLVLADLARSLVGGPLGLCLSLSITQIDPGLCSRSEDTTDSQWCDYIETGWIDLAGSFEDYWNARGKNLRQNLRNQRSKLVAQGVSVQMRVLTDGSEMAAAIERYGALESAGWKAGQGTAIHCDNAQGHFFRAGRMPHNCSAPHPSEAMESVLKTSPAAPTGSPGSIEPKRCAAQQRDSPMRAAGPP